MHSAVVTSRPASSRIAGTAPFFAPLIAVIAVLAAGSFPVLAGNPSGSAGRTASAYPEAVRQGREAAEAVLARAGAESCLRGKLNRALLGLSASCASQGERTPLCQLADRAVVVTPMNLAFMDETARNILELSE